MSTAPAAPVKRKPFKKQIYRGIELDKLIEMPQEEVVALFCSKNRRSFRKNRRPAHGRLVKKLQKSVKDAAYGEKPKGVKTHLRNMVITPDMVGSVLEVYGGKYWTPVEVRADMCGYYTGEFSLTYKPIRHGKVGHGATRGSKFTALR
jgi:small subunit ribosomal protein S15e